jgi:hypothetical protein
MRRGRQLFAWVIRASHLELILFMVDFLHELGVKSYAKVAVDHSNHGEVEPKLQTPPSIRQISDRLEQCAMRVGYHIFVEVACVGDGYCVAENHLEPPLIYGVL